MTWYSLLPSGLTAFEAWLVRVFIFLGTIIIAPWAFLILYDILLYIWRACTYEIPIIGGRARGRQRPQAPSFSERPDGRRRTFSLRGSTQDGQGENEQLGNSDEEYRSPFEINSPGDGIVGEDDAFGDAGKDNEKRQGVGFGVGVGVRYRKLYAEPDEIDGDGGS
ncbi:hypothetical protein PABG_02258 [Paracoccidioides brasiliensis Pb03]|nr:hypothetical protein PABG_02258 [Paracoccidioides brasiliensis Pb03]